MKLIITKDYGLKYNELDVFDILTIMRRLYSMLNDEQKKNILKILPEESL